MIRNRLLGALLGTMSLLLPVLTRAQSADVLRDYQQFEQARAAGDFQAAERYGRSALVATESNPATDPKDLVDLLRRLGEVSARAGDDQQAVQFYQRALVLQEKQLGTDHPDLVPTLTAIADLQTKDKDYTHAETILQRVLQIERAAYGEQHETVLATLRQLREVYRAAGDSEALARTEQQLRPVFRELAVPNRRYKQDQGFATVRVFYGTDRKPSGSLKPAEFYGGGRGDLQYGYLDVTIPQLHQEAALETQSRWDVYTLVMGQAAAKSRYVLLDKVVPLPRDGFVSALRKQIQAAPSKDVFIFIHGFNSTFEDAARRCAQLAYDLDFDGTPMLYSWPSAGSATAYTIDANTVGESGRKLATFLDDVVSQSGADRIHLIAHSMGNRALIEALRTFLEKRAPTQRQRVFGQIVFTAPDVDREYFIDTIKSMASVAQRVTLYASNNDLALRSSEIVNGAPRAGMAGVNIISLSGLDTIDMSAVPADVLGHTYFAANSGAIYDLFRLLWRGDPPPNRCGMSDHMPGLPLTVWLFNVSNCRGNDLLEAGVLLKRLGDRARAQVQANISGLKDQKQRDQWSLILQRLNTLLASDGALTPASGAAAITTGAAASAAAPKQ
ncbi:MAG TPA: alpha/beta hydrolase [Steroidobacteraceae bacterium]|jgi:esterase/lipase superfamily enzyme